MPWVLQLLARVLYVAALATSSLAAAATPYFPYGGCKARSCLGTPIAAMGPFSDPEGFCFTMYARPCYDAPGGNCCATLTKLFQKVVLQARPECRG